MHRLDGSRTAAVIGVARPGWRRESRTVHVQLPIGELISDLVRSVHCPRHLAHPGGAADHADHHGPDRASSGILEQSGQVLQLEGPADSRPQVFVSPIEPIRLATVQPAPASGPA